MLSFLNKKNLLPVYEVERKTFNIFSTLDEIRVPIDILGLLYNLL